MNTFELLYRIFRTHYNLDELSDRMGQKYRLALLGDAEAAQRVAGWLGQPTLASGGRSEDGPLILGTPLTEESNQQLRSVDAAIYHVGSRMPDEAALRQQAEWIPPGVDTLWLCEAEDPPVSEPAVLDSTLPRVHRVDPGKAAEQVPRLVLKAFPSLALRLGRDFAALRLEFARGLTARSARRMAVVAAASSVTVSIPLIGQILGLMAVTGETMVITAEQLRLCLLVGALHGRPLNFFDRLDELWPVMGGALGWRTLARQLVGLVPVAGPLAKAAIAWSGTWVVGESCRLFYEMGEDLPAAVRRQVEEEARLRGREEAARYLRNLRDGYTEEGASWPQTDEDWLEGAVDRPTRVDPGTTATDEPPGEPGTPAR